MKKIFLSLFIFIFLAVSGCGSDVSNLSVCVGNLQREVSNLRTQIGQLQAVVEDSAEKDTVYPFVLIISDVFIAEYSGGILESNPAGFEKTLTAIKIIGRVKQ